MGRSRYKLHLVVLLRNDGNELVRFNLCNLMRYFNLCAIVYTVSKVHYVNQNTAVRSLYLDVLQMCVVRVISRVRGGNESIRFTGWKRQRKETERDGTLHSSNYMAKTLTATLTLHVGFAIILNVCLFEYIQRRQSIQTAILIFFKASQEVNHIS